MTVIENNQPQLPCLDYWQILNILYSVTASRLWSGFRGGSSTKIFYSSKSTMTLIKFYLSTSKITDSKNHFKKYKYTKNYSITVTPVNVICYFPPLLPGSIALKHDEPTQGPFTCASDVLIGSVAERRQAGNCVC